MLNALYLIPMLVWWSFGMRASVPGAVPPSQELVPPMWHLVRPSMPIVGSQSAGGGYALVDPGWARSVGLSVHDTLFRVKADSVPRFVRETVMRRAAGMLRADLCTRYFHQTASRIVAVLRGGCGEVFVGADLEHALVFVDSMLRTVSTPRFAQECGPEPANATGTRMTWRCRPDSTSGYGRTVSMEEREGASRGRLMPRAVVRQDDRTAVARWYADGRGTRDERWCYFTPRGGMRPVAFECGQLEIGIARRGEPSDAGVAVAVRRVGGTVLEVHEWSDGRRSLRVQVPYESEQAAAVAILRYARPRYVDLVWAPR